MTAVTKHEPDKNKYWNEEDFRELVETGIHKPGRYIGQELGTKAKNWEEAKVRWALTYPEPYEVGISNLGHIILYSILNEVPGQLCDRAYLPGKDLVAKLKEAGRTLFAIESRRALRSFDILGFSLSYELGATNILEMLSLANIPLYSAKRTDHPIDHPEAYPLIFAGGPTATSNPEPYADFFDFFALGDGEEVLPEIGLVVAQGKTRKMKRSELLLDLAQIPGVYVPSLYQMDADQISIRPISKNIPAKILRRVAKPMPHYATGLVPNIETVHDRLTIEIRRGCTRGCRFCQPGMLTRPARDVAPQEVIKTVEEGMKKTGYSDFSLLSLSCSDYLALPAVGIELKNRLSNHNVSLQLPSQRIDRFDENIAHILGGKKQSGLTFAPEAGTQKLRDIINKGLTDEDLMKGIRKAMENGYRKIKLYFMIGLPGEEDDDVIGIASTCRMLQKQTIDLGRLKLNLTISNFTPKPHTPFQWHSVAPKEFERRQDLLRKELLLLKGIKANFTDVRISAMEDFLGRGDRKLAKVIEAAWREGAGMDAWFECVDQASEAWNKAIKVAGLKGKNRQLEVGSWNSAQSLIKQDLISFCSKPLPWDHIDAGVEKNWLAHDLQRALSKIVVPDCSFSSCSNCGVCGTDLGENSIVKATEIPKQKISNNQAHKRLCRIRLSFTKTNPIHLISHLDLVRMIERAMRRSNLPISYSEGFNSLPRLQIALALPLGVTAYKEWMDIDFSEILEAEKMREELQKSLPEGIKLTSAKNISVSKKSLSQYLKSAAWSFNLKLTSGKNVSEIQWENSLNYLLSRKEINWKDVDKKGRSRQRDCRSLLQSLQISKKQFKSAQYKLNGSIRIQLNALISDIGQSIKPIQVKFWLEEYFAEPITISHVTRDEIELLEC